MFLSLGIPASCLCCSSCAHTAYSEFSSSDTQRHTSGKEGAAEDVHLQFCNTPSRQHYFLPNGSDHTFNPTNQIWEYQQLIIRLLEKKNRSATPVLCIKQWKKPTISALNSHLCFILQKYIERQPHVDPKLQIMEKSITVIGKVFWYCWINHLELHLTLKFV